MAKNNKIRPADDEDELEAAEERPAKREPAARESAAPSRMRWFLSRLAVMLVLLAVLGWFAPWLASQSFVWKPALGFVMPELNGKVEIRQLSLGWLSAVRADGVVLKDDKGAVLAEVLSLKSSKTLYELALNQTDLGKFTVWDPKANVVLRRDGSNWEDFLKTLPKSESKESKPVQFALEVMRANVKYDDQIAGKQWELEGLALDVDFPLAADKPKTGKLSAAIKSTTNAAQPPGDLQAEFNWLPAADGLGSGKVQLKANQLALEISQGALVRAGVDVQTAGPLSADLQYEFARNLQVHTINLKRLSLPQAALASATYLSSDQPRFALEVGPTQVQLDGGKVVVGALDVRSNLLQVSGSGQASLSEISTAVAGGGLAADTQLQLQGVIDLAALAAQLPATLHLKNDTRIASGRVQWGVVSKQEPTGRLWQAGLQTDNLVAEAGGRRVQWDEPLKLEATARQTPTGVTIEQLTGKASFFDLTGSGTLATGELRANADLNRLVAELAQFVDFGQIKLAGNLAAKLNWQQNPGEQLQATATANVQQFELDAPGVMPWREENLQVGGQVTGRVVGSSLTQISAATFGVISSADQLEASLTKPVDAPGASTAWPLRFSLKGDLATWQPRVQAFVPLAGWRTAGGIDLQGAGSFSPATTELQPTKLILSKLAVSGPGVAINEQQVILETVGSWDQKSLTFTSTSTTLASSAVALRGDNIKAVLGGGAPTVQGVIDYRGDLARLMTWIPATEPRTYEVAGMLEGRLEAALRNGKVEAAWTNDFKNLTYASPDAPPPGTRSATLVANPSNAFVVRHVEPLVKISATASYDPAADTLALSQAQFQSSLASLTASGNIAQLTKQCVADLQGQVAYDLGIVSKLVNDKLTKDSLAKNPQTPPLLTPELTGQEMRKFAVKGPLLTGGATSATGPGRSLGLVNSELIAQAEIGWQTAKYAGLSAGPGVIPAKLERSILSLGPLDLAVNEGKIVGAPRVNLAGETMLLEMDKGPVIQSVRLSPELCDDWMKFVAPLLAGVTRAEGKFSIDLDGAKVPLNAPTTGSVGGLMTIHTAEIGPGPLGQHYLNLAKQVKDIAEGNYAGVGALFGAGGQPAAPTAPKPGGALVLPEQQVKFEMIDGRVHHQGLKMTVKDVVITTRGSVGLDQTMELVAEVPIQDAWLKQNKSLAGLKGQMLQVPIRGTLTQPMPDFRGIYNLTKDLAKSAATGIIQDRASKEINKFIPGFGQGAAPVPGTAPAAPGTAPAQPGTPSPQDLLNGVKGLFGPK